MSIKFTQNKNARGLDVAAFTMDISKANIALKPSEILPAGTTNFRQLYQHQKDAAAVPGRFVEINFPPRDGKTLCQAVRGIKEGIATGWQQRQLAAVPQNLIGNGFRHSRFELGGKKYEWRAQEADDLCNGLHAGRKGNRLLAFLESSGPFAPIAGDGFQTVTGLNAVTSIAALARFWKYDSTGAERTADEKVQLIKSKVFRNLTVWLDEAHHVRGAADPSEVGLNVSNILGDFVSHAVHYGHESLRVTLATATPYNSTIVLDAATKRRFRSIKRTFSDYLENPRLEIRQAVVKPVEFAGRGPVECLVNEIKKAGPSRFHLAFLPPDGSFWRKRKVATPRLVQLIKKQLAAAVPWAKVLDATTAAGGKELTAMQGGAATQAAYNIVLACRRGREGLDWLCADFLHVLYLQSQLWEANQVFTRPFSQFAGKRRVDVRYYIEAQRDTLEKFDTLVLTMRMALEQMDFIAPQGAAARIPEDRRVKLNDALIRSMGRGVANPVETLSAEYGNDADTRKYLRSLFTRLVKKNFSHEHAHGNRVYQAAAVEYRRAGRDLFKLGRKQLQALQESWFTVYDQYKKALHAGAIAVPYA